MPPIATSPPADLQGVVHKISKLSTGSILDALTLEEKVSLLSGRSFCDTPSIDRLNITSIKVSDGPSGCRGEQSHDGPASASFPSASCLASTFDPALIELVGAEIGKECRLKSVDLLMGPTINLHRDPRGGRNFECFSEDPVLTGLMGAAYVNGLQSQGVGACLKHLVCNERETRRKQYNVKVTSATLREVYLRPFEQIIHAAKPYSIMAAYNDINDVPCSQSTEVLDIVRKDFRYDGLIMSDWFGTKDGVASLKAGVDLEMPFPVTRGGRLIQAVRSGLLPIGHVDQAVRRVVDTAAKTPGKRDEERPFDNDPRRIALCRRVGADGMVLLRNVNHVLPLRPDADILVVGQHATRPSVGGGGSAMLNPPYVVTPLEAIQQAATGKVTHHPGVPAWRLVPELGSELCETVKINLRNVGSDQVVWSSEREKAAISLLDQRIAALGPDFTLDLATTIHPRQTGRHLLSVFCVAETEVYLGNRLVETIHPPHISVEQFLFERFDFETILPVELTRDVPVTLRVTSKSKPKTGMEPPPQGLRIGLVYDVDVSESIRQAEDLARSASQVVVLTGLDSDWEGEGSDRVNIDLPGHQGELVTRLAAVNPNVVLVNQSGGPVDLRCADRVSGIVQAFYGGMECGHAIADVLFGTVNPSGRLAMTFPKTLEECPTYESFHNDSDGLVYEEGSLFGYRSYLHRQIQPAYPFGFGLSYTTFTWTLAEVTGSGPDIEVKVDVKNTGVTPGRDVVQLYVSRGADEPAKLEAVAKTALLGAGEQERISLRLGSRAFARWVDDHWAVKSGPWRVSLSRDVLSEVVGLDVEL